MYKQFKYVNAITSVYFVPSEKRERVERNNKLVEYEKVILNKHQRGNLTKLEYIKYTLCKWYKIFLSNSLQDIITYIKDR